MTPDILVSHSSRDKEIVELLVNLLKAAFTKIPTIRCTSLVSHGLDSDQELGVLIQECVSAKVFVGLITPNSLRSIPVLLEIGARLGTTKKMHLILAAGTEIKDLDPLLKTNQRFSCNDQSQVQKLISNVSVDLEQQTKKTRAYQAKLEALSTRSKELSDSRWKQAFAIVPLDKIADYDIEPDYANFPFGELRSTHGVLFEIQRGKTVFQSANQRKVQFRIRLPLQEAVENPRSVYLAINAGDAQDSEKGKIIGRIHLEFSDSTTQVADLVLGENIREWAVNNPGELIIDPIEGSPLVTLYSGKNTSGNDSRLDCLEIPILQQHREKAIKAIILSRDNYSRAQFFVTAITIERSRE